MNVDRDRDRFQERSLEGAVYSVPRRCPVCCVPVSEVKDVKVVSSSTEDLNSPTTFPLSVVPGVTPTVGFFVTGSRSLW